MPKWSKIVLISALSLLVLLMLGMASATYMVQYRKADILKHINLRASEGTRGIIKIDDVDLWIWKEFPSVSLRLHNLKVADSLYDTHGRALIDARYAFLKLDISTLSDDEPQVNKIILSDAKIHVFIDSNDYTNTYVLQSNKPKKDSTQRNPIIDKIKLENVHLYADLNPKDKLFDIMIHKLDAVIKKSGSEYAIEAPLDATIAKLGFRMNKGAFMVNQPVQANTKFTFNTQTKKLILPKQTVIANGEDLTFSLDFDFTEKPGRYHIAIDDDNLDFKKGVAMLNQHIAKNFRDITTTRPIKVSVVLDGGRMLPDTPMAIVHFSTEGNTLKTRFGTLSEASFNGLFTNKYKEGVGLGDDNSIVFVEKITGLYDGLPFIGDSILVHDIKHPYLTARVRSDMDVRKLNEFIGKSIRLDRGRAKIDLRYSGLIMPKSPGDRSLNGFVHITNAKANYLPREMNLDKVNADIQFRGKDLEFRHISVHNGKSDVQMSGVAKNFLTAFFVNPEQVLLHFNVYSKYLNMDDFDKFVIPRKPVGSREESSGKKFKKMNRQLDELLDKGSMVLNMKVDKLVKDRFVAHNLTTKASLLSNIIRLDKIAAQFDKGSLSFNGAINQNQKNNPFTLRGNIKNIDIDKLFYAFEDFGLAKLKSENITGLFNAAIDIKGNFSDEAKLLTRSINGIVDFSVQEGALINLPAVQEIKKYVFKKRNLDNIRFHSLANKLYIEDGKVIINPMAIETSAINIYTKGIYSFHKGTDISIEIPVRNPAKDSMRVARGLAPNPKAGLKVVLRAYEDEEGNVSIKWDPRRKGDKTINELLDIDDDGELKYDEPIDHPNPQKGEQLVAEIPAVVIPTEEEKQTTNCWQKVKLFFKRKE